MNFIPTRIPEVILIEPRLFEDSRGYFMEVYQREMFADAGIAFDFVQDNQSLSRQGVLRGLHYQVSHVQGKLVRVTRGEVFDVAVDLRRNSPTFGQWVGATLSDDNKHQLWIPPKFAHGFLVISDFAEVHYKTTDYYDASGDRCILWNDPDLAINWPVPTGGNPIVSDKDAHGARFSEAEVF